MIEHRDSATDSVNPFSQSAKVSAKRSKSRSSEPTAAEPIDYGLVAPTQSVKNYVLDTNVLLHDPACLGRFKDNHICVPADVLAELDKFKSEQTERGANARKVHRMLMEMFAGSGPVTQGVPTDGGGSVRMVIYDPKICPKNTERLDQFHRIFPDRERMDHRILACVLLISQYNDAPVILVTKDLNMHLKARAVGLNCEDYLNDKVHPEEIANYETKRVEVDLSEFQRFASSGELDLEESRIANLSVNEYVLLDAGDHHQMPARMDSHGMLVRLICPDVLKIPDGHSLKPLNMGQKCLIDALLNPDISLVTCYGHAGTGKTLVAVAVGLHEMFNRRYNGVTISRPVVAMGDQLGFLPGTLEEKMRPWLQPIHDALDLLMRPTMPPGPRRKQVKKETPDPKVKKPWELLMDQGIIEIEALCYIRGRSIPNRFFILDEAQQLTPQEAKTVVTRMSRGSKLVLVGDPAQIDNPYVDSRSNGLVYTRNRLKNQNFTAHVALTRGERSELADVGARLM
ncbi:MAG: PhoH family protein [Verrucomicrobia bacterium]|nr:MAG: PhoH family protein [Verrucomicrobiota bacterium]